MHNQPKTPTPAPWLPLADENSQFALVNTGRGTLTRIEGDHAGDRIVGITETDFRHAMACVNRLAGFSTEEVENMSCSGPDGLVSRLICLEAQRDQMLAALEYYADLEERMGIPKSHAHETIAAVKGGAQ